MLDLCSWIIEVSLYMVKLMASIPKNLSQFREMFVYRGAGLGRFRCKVNSQQPGAFYPCTNLNPFNVQMTSDSHPYKN